jgi:two-component system cell cycle sensor histidine kinase/response regulator CckA
MDDRPSYEELIQKVRELELQLRQARSMEAIGALTGGITHRFNNILGAMIGCTELSLLEIEKGTQVHHHLTEALKAGERGKNLLKQIQILYRQKEKTWRPVKISLIIKEVIQYLRAVVSDTTEIRESIETDSDTIEADPVQIHQVLMNLCANAYQAMGEEGGVLEVRLADIDLDYEAVAGYPDMDQGSYLMLLISDTGHGIKGETVERIVDPSYAIQGLGKEKGLGLAVVCCIVRSHGGAITVKSEPEKGTTFTVFLPRLNRATRSDNKVFDTKPTQ